MARTDVWFLVYVLPNEQLKRKIEVLDPFLDTTKIFIWKKKYHLFDMHVHLKFPK